MKMTKLKTTLSYFLCIVLIAAMALLTNGCGDKQTTDTGTTTILSNPASSESEVIQMGEGSTSFAFTVTDKEGTETAFEIHTDKTTVGEALLELGLIEGDVGDYGLYVKKVNGITADYDTDGTYWAFYVDGEYATSGVDLTNITEGASYAFKVEK